MRKFFGVLLLATPVLALIGSAANGGTATASLGLIGKLSYYGAFIGLFVGGIILLSKKQ